MSDVELWVVSKQTEALRYNMEKKTSGSCLDGFD